MNRAVAVAGFRANGVLLLLGSIGIAHVRLHESGSPFKLFLHSLTFVAVGLFFAASPRFIIRWFGFGYALSLRIVAVLSAAGLLSFIVYREVAASEFQSSGIPVVVALTLSLAVAIGELLYTRRLAT